MAVAQHLPQGRRQAGDRHLNFHETRDNLVDADDLPPLTSFTTGLRRDHAAVAAGLTEHYSSGPVEGTVNKIKMLRRQTYGRAGFDLLRKRVLLA